MYSPDDVIDAVRRRLRLMAVSFVVLATVAFAWVMSLSHNYRSVATLQVLPEPAANSLVRSASQPTVGDRLSSIGVETLTRTRLEQIISDLNLYPELRRSTVMEAVVQQMRDDITFQTQMTDRNVFELGYTSKSPQVALTVATRLTALFLEENAKSRGQRAEATTEFVEAQLTAARAQLEEQERKVESYQIQHAGELPSQLQSNIQELNNSQLQLRQLVESINRERDQRLFLQRQLELVATFDDGAASGSVMVPGLALTTGDGVGSASPIDDLDTARARLKALELRLTPEHPDVQRAKRVIARLEQKAADGQADPLMPTASGSRTRQDLRVRQIQAQIDLADRQIASRQDDERRLRARIADYTSRIDKAPMRQSEFVVLTRDYEDTKQLYSNLLKRQQEASMAVNLERQEIGDRFRIIEPARLPEKPFSPSRRNYFLVSLLAALFLSLGLAAALELRDTSLRTEDDITVSLRLPVLATIPVLNLYGTRKVEITVHATNIDLAAERISRRFAEEQRRPSQRLADRLAPARPAADVDHRVDLVKTEHKEAVSDPPVPRVPSPFAARRQVSWSPVSASGHSAGVEQYRRLAAALIHAQVEHGIKVVMITSSVSGEGKSLTAANLAVTLSHSYARSTLLLDADQRDPSQHRIFNVGNSGGLSDYLRGRGGTQAAVQLLPGLTLLPAGPATSDPMGGLTSGRMKQLISDAAASFDFVIVDTPPATLVPDASVLAPIVDATVLVIAAGSTPYDALERAVEAVGRERILGTVLNRADDASLGAYGYGYGYPRT